MNGGNFYDRYDYTEEDCTVIFRNINNLSNRVYFTILTRSYVSFTEKLHQSENEVVQFTVALMDLARKYAIMEKLHC